MKTSGCTSKTACYSTRLPLQNQLVRSHSLVVLFIGLFVISGCGDSPESGSKTPAATLESRFESANALDNPREKTTQLLAVVDLAREQTDPKIEDLALKAAARSCVTISSPLNRAVLTTQVAEKLVESKLKSDALTLLPEIESSIGYIDDPIQKVEVASEVSPILAKSLGRKSAASKTLDDAAQTLDSIQDPLFKTRAYMQLIDANLELDRATESKSLFEKAAAHVELQTSARVKAEALAYLVLIQSKHPTVLSIEPAIDGNTVLDGNKVIESLASIESPADRAFAAGSIYDLWFENDSLPQESLDLLEPLRDPLTRLGTEAFSKVNNEEKRKELSETVDFLQ